MKLSFLKPNSDADIIFRCVLITIGTLELLFEPFEGLAVKIVMLVLWIFVGVQGLRGLTSESRKR